MGTGLPTNINVKFHVDLQKIFKQGFCAMLTNMDLNMDFIYAMLNIMLIYEDFQTWLLFDMDFIYAMLNCLLIYKDFRTWLLFSQSEAMLTNMDFNMDYIYVNLALVYANLVAVVTYWMPFTCPR